MRYKITLSYDGTEFCGWQSQPNGKSVQDAVERAAALLFGEAVKVTGSGRTDAGVHALGQVASFTAQKVLPSKNVIGGFNAYLPRTVRVINAEHVSDEFDARKSAKRKTYMYVIYTGTPVPLLNDRVLFVSSGLDLNAMDTAAKQLIGKHDFATFMAANGGAKTSVRTVFAARFERDGQFLRFYITADGFLYNMVRIIVAQLLKIGRGANIDIKELIDRRDRDFAKELAQACGLYLYSVDYGDANDR